MSNSDKNINLIQLRDKREIDYWCKELDCSEDMLRFSVNSVGRSYRSVEAFLYMNRDWLSIRLNRLNPQVSLRSA
jgi:hypothetical protein